mmetsp:Transcript_11696/g.27490  ORF Transcript_11696/g.27490 Transcript_11696/m.27490 type:complete len:93 (+) Transcript_11696:1387-1665(+)
MESIWNLAASCILLVCPTFGHGNLEALLAAHARTGTGAWLDEVDRSLTIFSMSGIGGGSRLSKPSDWARGLGCLRRRGRMDKDYLGLLFYMY